MEIKTLKARQLRPEPIKTAQCCVELKPQEGSWMWKKGWREEHYGKKRPDMNPMQCQRLSSHEIEGKPFCRIHAGQFLLVEYEQGRLKIETVK